MLERAVALRYGVGLGVLELGTGGQALLLIAPRELEHGKVQRMEAREGDELEPVPHVRELPLELRDCLSVEFLLPVEGGRAVVREHLPRESRVDGVGECAGLVEVRTRRLAPQEIGIRRVRESAR